MEDRLLTVPERFRGGLQRYVCEHIEPGNFLRLVLEDWKLAEAIARLDRDVTMEELRALLSFIHNDVMPSDCHGSPAKVKSWIDSAEKCRKGETDCTHDELWYESQPAKRRAPCGCEIIQLTDTQTEVAHTKDGCLDAVGDALARRRR